MHSPTRLYSKLDPILELIFRRSLLNGHVPSDWTRANVAPIFKTGNKHKPGNYRSVSLTLKCMEHVIVGNMAKHIDTNSILHPLQLSFHKNLSYDTQYCSYYSTTSLKTPGKLASSLYKVTNRRLTYKRDWYEVRGRTLSRVQDDFLAGRTQGVVLDGADSPLGSVMSRVT